MKYLRMPIAALAGMIATTDLAMAQEPFSDKFTKDKALNPGWTLVQPNPASSYTLSNKGLLLDASWQNGGSDLFCQTNYNGTRLLQPIGTAQDWVVTTKVKFAPSNFFQGAGFVVTTSNSALNCGVAVGRYEFVYQTAFNGKGRGFEAQDGTWVPFSGTVAYMQLKKAGSSYAFSYGTDGRHWTLISTTSDSSAYTYLGLDSLRQPYDGVGLDSTPVYSYFKIKVTK